MAMVILPQAEIWEVYLCFETLSTTLLHMHYTKVKRVEVAGCLGLPSG